MSFSFAAHAAWDGHTEKVQCDLIPWRPRDWAAGTLLGSKREVTTTWENGIY